MRPLEIFQLSKMRNPKCKNDATLTELYFLLHYNISFFFKCMIPNKIILIQWNITPKKETM